jgi:TolB-like protein/DNA-binding winged helix-turn-helix (wHTH) protein/Flp pilus assembly protein TadD
MPTPPASDMARFGDFVVDLRTGELSKNGVKVRVPVQPFQVLTLLLQRPGEMVTREELRDKLWPGNTFVDFDDGLNTAVRKLRQILGDSPEHSKYIETLPRRGYRLIPRVEVQSRPLAQKVPAEAPSAPAGQRQPPLPVPDRTGQNRAALTDALSSRSIWIGVLLAAAAVGALLVVTAYWWRQRSTGSPQRAAIRSLAVLPLANLSGDPNQEYFSDGISENLITNLGKLGGVRVISRTSVMQYKGTRKTLPEIAHELNVEAVVEGAVLRNQSRIRITAQLVRANPEEHLWADAYERDQTDLLAVQSDVAAAIATKVLGKLTPEQQDRLTSGHAINPDAQKSVFRAQFFRDNQRSAEGARKAVEYSQQATQLDPNSALAFTALSESYDALMSLGGTTPVEGMPKAQAAAERAVELDPGFAEAHTALAGVLQIYGWDRRGAEREIKRALELNPSDVRAHRAYAEYLSSVGETDEAVAEIKRAWQLDPLSLLANREVGRMLYFARRYDEAIAELAQTAEMFPDSGVIFNWLSMIYLAKGMPQKAVEMDLKDRANHGGAPEVLNALRSTFESSGTRAYWQKVLQLTEGEHPPYYYACARISIILGNKDDAFRWLNKAYQEHSVWMNWIKVDPALDPLRSDPRFQDLLRRMNLPS